MSELVKPVSRGADREKPHSARRDILRLVKQNLSCHELVLVARVFEHQPHLGLDRNLNVHHLDVAAVRLHALDPAGQARGGPDCSILHVRF